MSAQATHVEAVLDVLEGLGYKISSDIFGFEEVPSSVMDKAYRWEVTTNAVRELSGSRVEKDKTLNLWVAYKVTAKGNTRTDTLGMLSSIEAVEDALLGALVNLPGMVMQSAMSRYVANYAVFNVSFDFTYWRDLT
jgi:acyl-CoA-binding protein